MAAENLCFKDYITCVDDKKLSKTRKRVNKKSHKGRHYGGGINGDGGGGSAGAGGESISPKGNLLQELRSGAIGTLSSDVLSNLPAHHGTEQESQAGVSKKNKARNLFKIMIQRKGMQRDEIVKAFQQKIGTTESTAITYFEKFAKEFGFKPEEKDSDSGMSASPDDSLSSSSPADDVELKIDLDDEDLMDEEPREAVIRTVPNAHLVFKRADANGTYTELWIYNVNKAIKDSLVIQRNILAGTEIPANKTKSEDNSQSYKLITMGNAQMMLIKGLPE